MTEHPGPTHPPPLEAAPTGLTPQWLCATHDTDGTPMATNTLWVDWGDDTATRAITTFIRAEFTEHGAAATATVDPVTLRYIQASISPRRLNELEPYDPDQAGPIRAIRVDDTLWVFDGTHRCVAAHRSGHQVTVTIIDPNP